MPLLPMLMHTNYRLAFSHTVANAALCIISQTASSAKFSQAA